MVYRPDIVNDLCFVLMPFKPPFTGYYDKIIKPAVEGASLKALRADEIFGTAPIVRDVWESIWKARVVIADVTDKNPNVNYELGMCHALDVPTILITKRIEDVPFDYRHRRCITYNTDEAGWENQLRDDLTNTIKAALIDRATTTDLSWPYDTHAVAKSTTLRSTVPHSGGYAVLIFFLNAKYELLLIRHPFHKCYLPPGGGLKEGELPHTAVAERLREETGILNFKFHPDFHNPNLVISEKVEDVPGPYSVHLELRPQSTGSEFHYAFVYVCCFEGADEPILTAKDYQPTWMSLETIYKLPKGQIPFDDIMVRYEDILRHLGKEVAVRPTHIRKQKRI